LKTPCRHFFIAPFDIEHHHTKSRLLLRNDIVFRHTKPKIFQYNGLFSSKKSIIMPGRSLRFKMALSAYWLGPMMLSVSLAQHYEEEKEDGSDNSKESKVSFDADPVTAAPFLPNFYISHAGWIASMVLGTIAVILPLAFCVFVFLYRNNHVFAVGQPPFLYLSCLGALLSGLSIFLFAFDASSGRSEETFDAACVATTWLSFSGIIVT
jgi:hypothetical protein